MLSTLLKSDDVSSIYAKIITENLRCVLDRYARRSDSPWIDTKIDIVTGKDYSEDDILRGPNTIYSWIQGRALESLATHALWLKKMNNIKDGPVFLTKIDKILRKVLDKLVAVRHENGGHLFFFMTPEGQPFKSGTDNKIKTFFLNNESFYNYSDIFASKGMYAAANYLGNEKLINESKKILHRGLGGGT